MRGLERKSFIPGKLLSLHVVIFSGIIIAFYFNPNTDFMIPNREGPVAYDVECRVV